MNMEIEAPTEMMEFEFKFLEQMIGKPASSTTEDVWTHFLNNLARRLSQKNGFTEDGTVVSLAPQEQVPAQEPIAKEARHGEEEEIDACMICYEKPPDTTVTPCMHRVVCAECSAALEKTADDKICCQCRCPITGVYYPDNTLKPKI